MEEPICESHPFSYSSPSISNEAKQENPMYGMEESVSFGRFTSESLSWEKWSTFNRNRYVEEAEKYSRPGSVKQKRAFLEAHFKKVSTIKDASSSPDKTTTIQGAASESNFDSTSISNTHNEKEVETVDFGVDQIENKPNNEEVQLSGVKVVESDQEEPIQPTVIIDVEKQNPVTETQCGLVKTEEFSLQQSSSIDNSNSAPALIKRNPPLSSYILSVESGTPDVHPVKDIDNKYRKNDQEKKKMPFYKSINRKLGRLVKKIGISSKGSKKSWLETPHKEKPKNRSCQNLCFGSKLQSNSFSEG